MISALGEEIASCDKDVSPHGEEPAPCDKAASLHGEKISSHGKIIPADDEVLHEISQNHAFAGKTKNVVNLL